MAKTVEQYAIWLVESGALDAAATDMNEDESIVDADHPAALRLAKEMALAIRNNPRSFAEWCEAMGVRWNRHEEG